MDKEIIILDLPEKEFLFTLGKEMSKMSISAIIFINKLSEIVKSEKFYEDTNQNILHSIDKAKKMVCEFMKLKEDNLK